MRARRFATMWLVPVATAICFGAPSRAASVDDFALLDQQGNFHRLYYHSDAPAVVVFVQGNGCPIARNAIPIWKQLRDRFAPRGVVFWMLNANSQDTRAAVAAEAVEYGIDTPILVDETQLVAEGLGVTRTAEAIVIDPARREIVYRGPIDDRLGYETQRPARNHWLRDALTAHLEGEPIDSAERRSPGCVVNLLDGDRDAHRQISYTETIAPLLERRCRSCHRVGGVAPWSMSSYEMVRGWAPMMREVLRTRRMPPWHADPHVARFANDISLSIDEKRTLVHWIEAGAPRGDGPDPLARPVAAVPTWHLGEPDLVVAAPEQTLPATGVVPYRYETVDVPLERDVWIRAVDIQPTNPGVMHHGTAYLIPPDGGRRETLGPRFAWGLVAGYVPGREPLPFPDETGVFAPAGSRIRMQLHYTTSGKPERDTPRLALYFADGPLGHELKFGAAVNFEFEIPAGAKDHRDVARRSIDRDILVYQLTPHMHYRGKHMRFEVEYPDGSAETLLSVPSYQFNWQRRYALAEPKRIPAGSTLVVHAGFDNSKQNPANPEPDMPVYWGEQSFEEMLIGYFIYREVGEEEPGLRVVEASPDR